MVGEIGRGRERKGEGEGETRRETGGERGEWKWEVAIDSGRRRKEETKEGKSFKKTMSSA